MVTCLLLQHKTKNNNNNKKVAQMRHCYRQKSSCIKQELTDSEWLSIVSRNAIQRSNNGQKTADLNKRKKEV